METVGLNDSGRAAGWGRLGRRAAGTPGGSAPGGPAFGGAAPAGTADQRAPRLAEALLVIDALGRKCPVPIIMLAEQIRDVRIGEIAAVLADDPAAYTDIPAWCQLKSHDLAFREDHQTGWAFGIKRNY